MARKKKAPGRCRAGGRWLRHIRGDEHQTVRWCPECGRILNCRMSKAGKAVQLPGHKSRSKNNSHEKLEWLSALDWFKRRYWMEDVETMKAKVRRVKKTKPTGDSREGSEPKGGKERKVVKGRGRIAATEDVREAARISELMWGPVTEFLDSARQCATTFSFRRYVRDRYVQTFKKRARESVHPALVHAAVGYELQYRGFKAAKRIDQLSESFLARRKAALTLRLDKYGPEQRKIMDVFKQVVGDGRVSDNHVSRRQTMSKSSKSKKSDKGSKAPVGRGLKGTKSGMTQAAFWIKLFKDNAKAKGGHLTNEELSEVMQAEFPSAKQTEVTHIVMHRRLFNQGKIRGQEGEPKVTSFPYDEDGKKMPLPTRGSGGGRKTKEAEAKEQAKSKKTAKGKAKKAGTKKAATAKVKTPKKAKAKARKAKARKAK